MILLKCLSIMLLVELVQHNFVESNDNRTERTTLANIYVNTYENNNAILN